MFYEVLQRSEAWEDGDTCRSTRSCSDPRLGQRSEAWEDGVILMFYEVLQRSEPWEGSDILVLYEVLQRSEAWEGGGILVFFEVLGGDILVAGPEAGPIVLL